MRIRLTPGALRAPVGGMTHFKPLAFKRNGNFMLAFIGIVCYNTLYHQGEYMHPLYEKADKLSKEVYEAALEVKAFIGAGVILERIYQRCLMRELELRGHKVACEVSVPITYKGYTFEEKLRIDILVDDCLVVECKAVDDDKADMDRFRAQTLTYLKLMNIPLGMVINFAGKQFGKSGISRVILKGASSQDQL